MSSLDRRYLPDRVQTADLDDTGSDTVKLKRINERFQEMQTFWSEIHTEGGKDDAFVAGQQWEEELLKEREEEGRPALTYNHMPKFTRQIVNRIRQNRPQVRVKPVESDRGQTPDISNVQGTSDYSHADVMMGIIRSIEHQSRANHAYDTAVKHAIEHAFGYFRLNTRYCVHDPFTQEIFIERIKNSYGVYLDPNAEMADFSDMADAFIIYRMTRRSFEKKYPDAQPGSFHLGTQGINYDAATNEQPQDVMVATYYWVDWRDDEVVKMSDGKVHYWSDIEDVADDTELMQGVHIVAENGEEMRKKVKRPVVMWRKLTNQEFLTPETETVFEKIPIFPVLGEEQQVDGRTIYISAIRHARDAQKSYNYFRTAAVEAVALAPKAPWVVTQKQINGHQGQWENANRQNLPYLNYNHQDGVPPPQRQPPPPPSAAELTAATQDAQDMQEIVGIHEASLGAESNERTGKAILARQQQGNIATFTFPDNLNRALEAMGRCLVQAIPRIYDTDRVLRIRLPDDTEDFVQINRAEIDQATGTSHLVHDLAYGKYDVVIDTGPSYQTQREEAIEAMLELLGILPPELLPPVVHLAVKNMAFPGADEISAVLRKAVPDDFKSEEDRAADLPKGVVFDDEGNPVDEKTGEPYQPPMTPELQVRQQEAQVAQGEIQAKLKKAEADVAKAQADMAEAQRDMAQLQAEGTDTDGDGQIDTAGLTADITENVRAMLAEAFEKHEQNPKAHKAFFEESQADAITKALRAVKRYVQGELRALPAQESDKPSPSGGGGGGSNGGDGDTTVSSVVVPMVVDRKPSKLTISTSPEGKTEVVPEYDKE